MEKRLFSLCVALLLTVQLVLPAAATALDPEPEAATVAAMTDTEEENTVEATKATEAAEEAEEATPPEPEVLPAQQEAALDPEEAAPLADDAVPANACGENLTWKLENGILTISGTGDMWDYTYDYDNQCTTAPWAQMSYGQVILEEGVTSVGDLAFAFTYADLSRQPLVLPDSLRRLEIRLSTSASLRI